MPASLGDVEKITAKMGRIHPGDTPPSDNPDATPIMNGDTHHSNSNGYLRNESRMSTSSPDPNKSQTRTNDAPSDASPASNLSRKPPQTAAKRAPLFNDVPDSTEEACSSFKVIADCLYGSKNMGSTANDALDCDCREDWHDGINYACGEDCINRATRLECLIGASGSCGDSCQNQRFQRKLNASVSVIKTEKKGYGLRANTDLETNDFVHEYVGEVINEPTFRRRMVQYDEEGIKHFYFMSLTKNEFVDATKKGGLGRFCNHSCNPNCYVDKWVIGDKLRMGIFVLRSIQAGEELTFNYNVDRYGADPQPCYCGEPTCVGFIGGRTQTERATKLPTMVVEALGIDDGDGWDTMVTKKFRKKRSDEDDEEYVNSLEVKGLAMEGVKNVMASLFQSKEKWIIVKVLERIQNTEDEDVLRKVVRLHVYKIMKLLINTWAEDDNVILQVLDVLTMLPRITKNKIADSGIEPPVRDLTTSENQRIADASKKLIEEWDTLEVGYRIRRRKADSSNPRTAAAPGAMRSAVFGADNDVEPSTPASKPVSPLPSNVEIPKGPKSNIPQRNPQVANRIRRFRPAPPIHPRRNFGHDQAEENPPPGWFMAKNPAGVPYYYNAAGATTWERPTASVDPKLSQSQIEARIIQKIIDDANKAGSKPTPRSEATGSSSQTPPESSEAHGHGQEAGAEKWRSLPVEKQMKIYEHTIFPHIKYVLDKFSRKLPKEELKRLAKDILKKLAASDYKNGRVQDPTAPVAEKWSRVIKNYVKDFLDKAVAKYHGHDRLREPLSEAARAAIAQGNSNAKGRKSANPQGAGGGKGDVPMTAATPEADAGPELANGASSSSPSAASVKRKHDGAGEEEPLTKRAKEEPGPDAELPPPPPPPPPEEITAEERDLLAQEQELMRENEEAQRLEDEEEALRGGGGDGARQLAREASGVAVEGASA